MRKMMYYLTMLTLMSFILSGCQSENMITIDEEKTNTPQQSEVSGESKLISKIIITKGTNKTTFEDDNSIETLENIISSAVKEHGIVNMANTDTYMDVIYENGKKQKNNLWIGKEGQESVLMNTDDTHTIYTISKEMTNKLILLME